MPIFRLVWLLPQPVRTAVTAITGRRAFWPFIPRVGSEGIDETHGTWSRIAAWVGRGPRRVWIGTIAVLLILCLGLTQLNNDLTSGNGFRDDAVDYDWLHNHELSHEWFGNLITCRDWISVSAASWSRSTAARS